MVTIPLKLQHRGMVLGSDFYTRIRARRLLSFLLCSLEQKGTRIIHAGDADSEAN